MPSATAEKPKLADAAPAPVETPSPPVETSDPLMDYKMPPIAVGDTVLWYVDGDFHRDGYAGLVVGVGRRSITLGCCSVNTAFNGRDTVHHISDPLLGENPARRKSGGWDYAPQAKRLMALEERLSALEKGLGS